MIGQEIGLYYLMPLEIETLTDNLFAEGDIYEGDQLKNVLNLDSKFWDDNKNYWQQLNNIIKDRIQEIAKMKFYISKFDLLQKLILQLLFKTKELDFNHF